ncbi:dual 3',5'-cyclic-AMP and -GMP phosphodiesterase 11A-like isoform X1 [Arapaima gigas]
MPQKSWKDVASRSGFPLTGGFFQTQVPCRRLLTVRKIYHHNWHHAFDVSQCMFIVITTAAFQEVLSDTETLALMVGSLCHDLDHRGTNNAFQAKPGSALAQLYGTSATLEHHHFNHAVMILQSEVPTASK